MKLRGFNAKPSKCMLHQLVLYNYQCTLIVKLLIATFKTRFEGSLQRVSKICLNDIFLISESLCLHYKTMSEEEKLLSKLFQDYNPSARPVLNSSETVTVVLGFSLLQIQSLVSCCLEYMRWMGGKDGIGWEGKMGGKDGKKGWKRKKDGRKGRMEREMDGCEGKMG